MNEQEVKELEIYFKIFLAVSVFLIQANGMFLSFNAAK